MPDKGKWFILASLALILVATGCERGPATYADCLRAYAGDTTAAEARSLCGQAFPRDTPFYEGTWYYATQNATECERMAFDSTGRYASYMSPICEAGSQIECSDDRCYFTCLDYANSDSTAIWLIREIEDAELPANMPGTGLLVRRNEAPPEEGFGGNRVDSLFWLEEMRVTTFRSSRVACESQLQKKRRDAATDTAAAE